MCRYRVIDKPTIGRTRFHYPGSIEYGWWTVSVLAQFDGDTRIVMLGDEHDNWHDAIREAHDILSRSEGTPQP
ncbi:hypothetical protein [Hoyosella subflava]|nr:hypothetical protein [Hoyosella subflava]